MLRRAGARGELRPMDGKKRVGNGEGRAFQPRSRRVPLGTTDPSPGWSAQHGILGSHSKMI